MRFVTALGVFLWIWAGFWLLRLNMGLEHPAEDRLPAAIVGAICGGLGAVYVVAVAWRPPGDGELA